jgi:3-phenylpropionate/cinnamic acid dioxygenase small subunit
MTDTDTSTGTISADDRLEILERLALYGMLIDDRDWDGLRHMFTEDAVFDVSDVGLPPVNGLPAIRKMMESVQHPLAHLITNAVVESAEDDTVRTRCRLLGVEQSLSIHVGQYRDVFVRTPEGWRIRNRSFTSHPEGSIRAALADRT